MGGYIAGHVLTTEPDVRKLAASASGSEWTLYRYRDWALWLLDTWIARPGVAHQPFLPTLQFDSASLPAEFPEALAVAEILRRHNYKEEVRCLGDVLHARRLSEALGAELFSFAADDDITQWTCTCVDGRVVRLHQVFELLDMVWAKGRFTFRPLEFRAEDMDEAESPEEELLEELGALPEVKMLKKRKVTEDDCELHGIVLADWPEAAGDPCELLGIGGYAFQDLDEILERVASSR